MNGNWLFRYLAEEREPEEEPVVTKPAWRCPQTDGMLACQDIPRPERCENCLLRTRHTR